MEITEIKVITTPFSVYLEVPEDIYFVMNLERPVIAQYHNFRNYYLIVDSVDNRKLVEKVAGEDNFMIRYKLVYWSTKQHFLINDYKRVNEKETR